MDIVSIEHGDIVQAIDIHRLHRFSFWDYLIIRMAQKTNCTILYSEDMPHGQQIGGVKVINPFKDC
jgi:predicted nucleic acid-binding protein